MKNQKSNVIRFKRKQKRRICCLFFLCLLCITIVSVYNLISKKNFISDNMPFFEREVRGICSERKEEQEVSIKELHSKNVYLWNRMESRKELEVRADEKIYPASMTKIMTAVVCLESGHMVSEQLTVPDSIFEKIYQENASVAGFLPGEIVTMEDLLYGVMLPSGADSCLTLAEELFGGEGELVEQMNQKAMELGMTSTHFCNCTGLWEEEHYTSTSDIAKLLEYALKNETFREIFTSRRHNVMPTNKHPEGFTFYSTMFEGLDISEVTCGKILGGKTGYTSEAGLCLASLAEIGGQEYILVTAGAKGDHNTAPYHIEDAKYIYNQLN